MKLLVDAQLPRRLAWILRDRGHDALHTLDLPEGNVTTDAEIERLSRDEQRIVVTKDADFVSALLLGQGVYQLLLVSTGNIRNAELEALFIAHLEAIEVALHGHTFVELPRDMLIIHQ